MTVWAVVVPFAILVGGWVVLVAAYVALLYAHGERERERKRERDRERRQRSRE